MLTDFIYKDKHRDKYRNNLWTMMSMHSSLGADSSTTGTRTQDRLGKLLVWGWFWLLWWWCWWLWSWSHESKFPSYMIGIHEDQFLGMSRIWKESKIPQLIIDNFLITENTQQLNISDSKQNSAQKLFHDDNIDSTRTNILATNDHHSDTVRLRWWRWWWWEERWFY